MFPKLFVAVWTLVDPRKIMICNITLYSLFFMEKNMILYLSEQSIPYLPLIISVKLIGFLIILAIARNNRKKFESNNFESNNKEA